MKYRKEIDGLRALAVVPVILFHAGFEHISGGFLGVDVFFTISGFLITSLILADMDRGQFSLATFYVRRIKRILPALLTVLTCSTLAALAIFTPYLFKFYAESLMSVATFSSNIYFWLTGGYFGLDAELKPLLHTWSLAVEEQYYILFPLALMLFWRIGKTRLFLLILLGMVLSLGLAQWGAYNKPGGNFFLLPTRMWQILLGSCAAFYFNMHGAIKAPQWLTNSLSLAGLALITASYFVLDSSSPLPSLLALMPTMGTVFIIMFTTPQSWAYKILSAPVMVAIGLISYSAYLWHQPLFVFARYALDTPSLMIMSALSLLALGLAGLTWYCVEQPCRHTKSISQKTVFLLAFLGLGATFLVGWAGVLTKGYEGLYLNFRLTPEQKETYLFVKQYTVYPLSDKLIDDGACRFWQRSLDKDSIERFNQCYEQHGKAVVVLGDSHAMNLYNIVVKQDFYPFVVGVLKGGCRAYEKLPGCDYENFDRFLGKNADKIHYILFHQAGSHMIINEHGEHKANIVFKEGATYTFDISYFNALLDYAQSLNRHVTTYWIGPFIESQFNFKSEKNILAGEFKMAPTVIPIFEEMDARIIQAAKGHNTLPPSHYISLIDWMNITDRSLVVDGCLLPKDLDHLSYCGEDYWARQLKEKFLNLHQRTVDQ